MHFIPRFIRRPLRSIRTMWRRSRPMWSDVIISRTVFRHNAFSSKITKIKKVKLSTVIFCVVNTQHRHVFSVHRKKISKISDITTITNFSIPPSSTGNPDIIPSDDPGEALSVSSKDIHLSKHAKISGIHCTLWPQCTNVTDRQTDTGIIR